MSPPIAQYAFLPWIKQGIGGEIARVEGTPGTEPRAHLPISVRFNSDDSKSGTVELELFGPGEVRGFDTRTIVRTWPRSNVMDAEPNYFALIEFDLADLPWRYTPAKAGAANRLTPWLALIVLGDDEIENVVAPSGDGALGQVKIKEAKGLPRAGQLWAWAHAQVSGDDSVDAAQVESLVVAGSSQIISRIVCPRRLQANRAYTGFLVPTFKRGVLAGLAQDPATTDALELAWSDPPSGQMTLPVYYQWRFGTGPSGDFESLARMIKAFEAPASVGIRDLDVSAPSPGFPAANALPLGLRGMLESLSTTDTEWKDPAKQTWIARLKALLNLPADRVLTPGSPRTVAPPLYGQWHAAANRCEADLPNQRPVWFQELSVDPRFRVGAGLGTRVVQANQEPLMASAWEQYDRIRQLNEELRQAQLARELAARLHTRHVMIPDAGAVLALTAPVHARIKASPTTIRSALEQSPIPGGVLEGAFRRIARPLGPIGRRQGRETAPTSSQLLDRLNQGTLSAAKPPPVPSALGTPQHLGAGIAPADSLPGDRAAARRTAHSRLLVALLLLVAAILFAALGVWLAVVGAVALGGLAFAASRRQSREAERREDQARRAAFVGGQLSGDLIRAVEPPSAYVPAEAPAGGAPAHLPTASDAGVAAASGSVAAMRDSLAAMLDRVTPPTEPLRVFTPVAIPALAKTLGGKLNPHLTVAASYRTRIQLVATRWKPSDPLDQIMAAPEFPQPMYQGLVKLSPDWLLPGFKQIPPNSATLLRTNQTMIEAYMVGLNHEFARELLWREYPTDQRGTCFRQFWDTRGFVAPPGRPVDPESLKDITQIHGWPRPSELGMHSPRPPVAGGDYLVLFIRGDLLRRYPNTLIYAARGKWTGSLRDLVDPAPDATPAETDAVQRWPLFSGFLEPDATFFGFALTPEEAQGDPNPGGDPGWFFVLQEATAEPKFGLDEPDPELADALFGLPVLGTDWSNLSWSNLVSSRSALAEHQAIDLNANLPDTSGLTSGVTTAWHADQGLGPKGSRASDVAFITFQQPMRVAIHGADMIP